MLQSSSEGAADLYKEQTVAKHYTDKFTTASAALNRQLEDLHHSNMSRKTNFLCLYFWRCVSPFLGNPSHIVAHPLINKPVEGSNT